MCIKTFDGSLVCGLDTRCPKGSKCGMDHNPGDLSNHKQLAHDLEDWYTAYWSKQEAQQ